MRPPARKPEGCGGPFLPITASFISSLMHMSSSFSPCSRKNSARHLPSSFRAGGLVTRLAEAFGHRCVWGCALSSCSLGRWRIFRVTGHSMEPRFGDGDVVLIHTFSAGGDDLPKIGSVVVARSPVDPKLRVIKTVISHGDNTIGLGSDNPVVGHDSRHFGSVGLDGIIGVVTKRLWKAG